MGAEILKKKNGAGGHILRRDPDIINRTLSTGIHKAADGKTEPPGEEIWTLKYLSFKKVGVKSRS